MSGRTCWLQEQVIRYPPGVIIKVGMELPGIVTNITNFGAFVDIGIHDDGLVHVSQMGPRGTDPTKVVKLHQQVRVAVTAVDLDRGRISLRLLK